MSFLPIQHKVLACLATLALLASVVLTARGATLPKVPSGYKWVKKSVVVTGYCLGPCSVCGTRGKTAAGFHRGNLASRDGSTRRIVAADRAYAFGTKVYFDGALHIVGDRGGAVHGSHLDKAFLTHKEAMRWGKKHMTAYFLVRTKK